VHLGLENLLFVLLFMSKAAVGTNMGSTVAPSVHILYHLNASRLFRGNQTVNKGVDACFVQEEAHESITPTRPCHTGCDDGHCD
jgi:hypothetical protein